MLIAAIVLVVVYLAFGSYIWWAMNQPPEKFGRVMAKLPGPVPFLLFPFETFWTRARAGHLRVGDPAPDFSLVSPFHIFPWLADGPCIVLGYAAG